MDTLLLLILATILLATFANAATILGVDSRDGFRPADGGPLA
jgi:hypothetical protein